MKVCDKKTSVKTLAVWEDIKISRREDLLILENSRIRRVLDLSPGAPRTISLQTADGTELASAENPVCDIGFIGMHEAGKREVPWRIKSVRCSKKQRDLFEMQRVTVDISMEEATKDGRTLEEYYLSVKEAAV